MQHNHLVPLFIFGTLLITLFAIAIVISVLIQKQRQVRNRLARQQLAFEYSRSLLHTRIEVQESTLNMLAEELHDHIAQMLTGCFMQLTSAAGFMVEAKGKVMIEAARSDIKDAIRDVRLLSQSLATAMIERRDLQEAIQTELSRIQAFSNISCTLQSSSLFEPQPEQRLLLFRVIQEALQNAVKHAQAKHIRITIDDTESLFLLSITDDGIGFDMGVAERANTLGLINMQHRVALLQGAWRLDSAPGAGTTIRIEIPVNLLHGKDTNSPR